MAPAVASKRKGAPEETQEDKLFEYAPPLKWKAGTKQNVMGSEIRIYSPTKPIKEQPDQVEFEVTSPNDFLSFGPYTRFQVSGVFETKLADPPGSPWTPLEGTDDAKKVCVQPNWLESMIKSVDIFNGNQRLVYSDEGRWVPAYINAFLYNFMSKEQKKLLAIRGANTVYSVPSNIGGWNLNEEDGTEWINFAPNIFTGRVVTTDWIPPHIPPFFQNSSYLTDGEENAIVPMPLLGSLQVRITFIDHLDNIFKAAAGQTANAFRFRFTKFDLHIEQLRTNPLFRQAFLKQHRLLGYPGCTKIIKVENNVLPGTTNWKTTFSSLPFPEGLFIFTLPKTILAGNYDYQDNTDGQVFSAHNIKELRFTYGEKTFFSQEPNIGQLNNDAIEYKMFADYLRAPPFGVKMDPDKITFDSLGGAGTPYPHVYVNLCNYGGKSRILPISDDGSIIGTDKNLDITLTFDRHNAPANVSFIFCLFYTDVNLVLDTNEKQFRCPYVVL